MNITNPEQDNKLNPEEVGSMLNFSQERVRQIQTTAQKFCK